MEEKLREILEERKNFVHTACLIDSLLRIDDEDIEYCKGCYYNVWNKDYSVKVCVLDIDVNEAR